MARHIALLPSTLPSTIQIALAAMTLLFCAFAFLMCASHSRRRRDWTACYGFFEEEPVIEHVNETMMTSTIGVNGVDGQQAGDFDESMLSREQTQRLPLWQKNILMGGKCQLPDFSGVIIYDSNGKILPPTKNSRPLLTWK